MHFSAPRFIILLLAGFCIGRLPAQSQCPPGDCDCLQRAADGYARIEDYVNAIRQYNAAIQCDPVRKRALNARIEEMFVRINYLRNIAEQQREIALRTEKQVVAAAARAARNAADMQAQQHEAELQTYMAEAQRIRAELSAQEAAKKQQAAAAEAQRTREALNRLQMVFGDLTDIFLQQAGEFMYQLEYDSAFARLREAAFLHAPDRARALRRMQIELAYLFNETGETALLAPLLDSLGLDRPVQDSAAAQAREVLRTALERADSSLFDTLERRYYPEMIEIAGGTFRMGSKNGEKDERPVHEVRLDRFYLARTETTWWQYSLYCRASHTDLPRSPSWGRQGDNPVVNVSWEDAQGYVKWLRAQKSSKFRLPTEAEWEYAARGGAQGAKENYTYAGSDDLESVGWFDKNAGNRTHPVASKKPNQLDLYDMSGNAWEWCADSWHDDYRGAPENGNKSWESDKERSAVLRGGSWYFNARICRVARRNWVNRTLRIYDFGFRLARGG